MPNVALITNEDQPLNLPAHAIKAVISVVDQEFPNAIGSLSIIYAEFRGGMTYFLGQPAAEVLEAVKAADILPERWVAFEAEMPAGHAGELHAIDRAALRGFHGHGKGGMQDDSPWLEAYIEKPSANPAGRDATLTLRATDENRAALSEILSPSPAASPGLAPRKAKPRSK